MERINRLCSYLNKSKTFADVGCDHGYCTGYMLKNGLCESAVISDVSEKCLKKAEELLKDYIALGKVTPVVCDGLEKIDPGTETVLIAGMGGEEILNILKNGFIPQNFVFQPMKNARKLRAYLIERGAEITVDECFESGGKFYFVIKGKRDGEKSEYSQAELEYGKNFKSDEFRRFLTAEIQKLKGYLARELNAETRKSVQARLEFAEGVLSGEIK